VLSQALPLWEGKLLDDGTLQCGYHGWCYDASGACVAMPNQPNVAITPSARLHAYPVIEQDGLVWVWPGDATLSSQVKPPRVPELADPRYEAVISDPIYVRANSRLLLENLLDITHFFPLHDGNIGDRENSLIPVGLREETTDGNAMVMTTRSVSNYRLRRHTNAGSISTWSTGITPRHAEPRHRARAAGGTAGKLGTAEETATYYATPTRRSTTNTWFGTGS
jgi:phenylpropionate dioxygenase-like ring-hydroxylating dioxygenase large terminal subunit